MKEHPSSDERLPSDLRIMAIGIAGNADEADEHWESVRLNKAATEIENLRGALRAIVQLPSGSQGAYGKFRAAQNRAREALGL